MTKLFALNESTTLYEMRHENGVLTLRFRDGKTGRPGPVEYDYPDVNGERLDLIQKAERPGKEVRRLIRGGALRHSNKREVKELAK